ncbi:MAG: hypothetical protein QOG00_3688 [Pyrinomonadaceae bacterium]|nr:hypothetical protein [Pyrinomonadaceae bacterium]
MVKAQTLTYTQHLDNLPTERRAEVERVWGMVRKHVRAGFAEEIGAKFLSFKAGDEWLVALANQKNYISLHLIPLYMFPEVKAKFDDAASKKLKRGKGCINFLRAEELPLETLGEILGSYEAGDYAERMRQLRRAGRPPRKKATGKD